MKAMPSCTRLSHAPSYEEFYDSYLKPNVPVIIGSDLVERWPALKDWTTKLVPPDDNVSDVENGPPTRRIDWDHLTDRYGLCQVTVADCSMVDSFGNQERDARLFRDVVSLWTKGEGQHLYVKDWHLARAVECHDGESTNNERPNIAFYTTPDIFRDDWMNAYYSAHTDDDFRFVYVGAKGTFTPLHRDVYTSYSWSTNVCGRKRWWLFPPEQTPYLFMKGRNMVAYDARRVDHDQFPDIHKADPIVIEQNEGETLFVPSGWYHQVENLTDCISVNHNWCNSVNLPSLYKSMCDKVLEVEQALEDVRDMLSSNSIDDKWKFEWVEIVQDVVKHDAGWNWLTFWRMVLHAFKAALNLPSQPATNLALRLMVQNFEPQRGLFTHAHASLRPPFTFIKGQVQECWDDFVLKRDRWENHGAVHTITSALGSLLTESRPSRISTP